MELVLVGDKPLATAGIMTFETGLDSLLLDATQLGFASPLDLAGLVATAHWASAESIPVTVKVPTDDSVASYLERMNVLRRMPSRTRVVGRVPTSPRTDLQGRLLEVTHLTEGNVDDVADQVGRLVTSFYADYSPTAGHVVYRACGELLANAVEHGRSVTGAFVAAQTYTGETTDAPRLEFAVCDTGIGVMNHLRRNPRHSHLTRDEIALSTALQAGVSGVEDDRGNGLSDLVDHTRHHGRIHFQMRSGRGEIRVCGNAETREQTLSDRPDQTTGTWAWLAHRMPTRE
ncbi:hypothetical protein [Nocardioides sp. SYSU DS0651]|uniref:hypothetical protein n=1 Tax=Nocardioides sp. SYSU DS0651 TaxID=3415955 RepID=UPI003F4B20DF